MPLFTSRKQQRNIKVSFQNDMMLVDLPDGKQQVFPLAFFPALQNASEEERNQWVQTANGLYWEKLGLNIAV